MSGEKKYYCITCNAEKGNTVELSGDIRKGELVCKTDPKHRFRMTKSGFLEAVSELR